VKCFAGLNALVTRKSKWLVCTEMNPFGEQSFRKSTARLGADLSAKASYVAASAADSMKIDDVCHADVLIVDPPRKGLDAEVIQALMRPETTGIKRIIYVSCGIDALDRDLKLLVSSRWRISSAMGCVLFPGSDHIETVTVLDSAP
jgi:23S rRNA (uracil1939-C5)-methyltransferase